MSQNRAVQAAQRRRAGGPEPAPPGRGPQPSINSSQMFAQQGQQGQGQIRPGTSGRLAGQQAQLQQQQMQQQMHQQMQEPKDQGLASVNRMTLAQAITLITLRLGKVETHLHEQDQSHFANPGLDSGIIDVIMSRLEALETQSQSQSQVSNASVSSSVANSVTTLEVSTMKQNIELLKTAIAQSKSTIVGLTNEQRALKSEVESLKSELSALQGLAMENNQQIMKLSLAVDLEANLEEELKLEGEEESNDEEEVSNDDSEIVGTDLKDLIEKELKL